MHIETIRFLVIFLCDIGIVLSCSYLYSGYFLFSVIFTTIVILIAYFAGAYDCFHRPSFGIRITTQFILLISFVVVVVVEYLSGISMNAIHKLDFWIINWLVVNIALPPINILLRHLFPISAVLVGRRDCHRYLNLAQILGFQIKSIVPFSKLSAWLEKNADEYGKIHNIEAVIFTSLKKTKLTWVKVMAERYFSQFLVFRSSIIFSYFIGFLFQHISVSPLYGIHRRLKRTIDVIVVLIFIFFSWPLFLFISILIKVDSQGPIFFKSARIGKDLRKFELYKFRTMYNDAESKLKVLLESDSNIQKEFFKTFKIKNDPRVTKIGIILRKWSIDEFPQLINVLKGEMSLVGYRPILTNELEHRIRSILVFWTIPGITGQWQISGRSDTTYQQRIEHDMQYLRRWSYIKDLKILLRTIPAVIRQTGAY